MKSTKKKVGTKKAVVITTKKKMKTHSGSQRVLRAAQKIRKTTKKMVDDVFLKLVGMRVLERAQEISASLKEEKSAKAASAKSTKAKPKAKKTKKARG